MKAYRYFIRSSGSDIIFSHLPETRARIRKLKFDRYNFGLENGIHEPICVIRIF